MSQHEEVAADRLVDTIRSLQMGRKSGVLTAKRGQGAIVEIGTLVFVKGRITEAKVGKRTGSEAINWLSTWRNCWVAFGSEDGAYSDSPVAGSRTDELRPRESGTRDTPPPPSFQQPPLTGDLFQQGVARPIRHTPMPPAGTPVPRQKYPFEKAVPMMQRYSLSRTHLHLFMLVDGSRTLEEIANLMGRSRQDTEKLLQELKQAGVLLL